jgi:hypothetical protein
MNIFPVGAILGFAQGRGAAKKDYLVDGAALAPPPSSESASKNLKKWYLSKI